MALRFLNNGYFAGKVGIGVEVPLTTLHLNDPDGSILRLSSDAHSDNNKIEVEGTAKIKAKYSIEYLKKMIGGSKLADEVSIQFNKDYPLKLEYKTIDKVLLSFILAPRVENE